LLEVSESPETETDRLVVALKERLWCVGLQSPVVVADVVVEIEREWVLGLDAVLVLSFFRASATKTGGDPHQGQHMTFVTWQGGVSFFDVSTTETMAWLSFMEIM